MLRVAWGFKSVRIIMKIYYIFIVHVDAGLSFSMDPSS